MNLLSYLLGIAAALLILVTLVEMLRRGKLRERHTFWWILAGLLGLFFGLFPQMLDALAKALGIEVPLNLVFFVTIVVLFLVYIQQSSELTRSEERIRTLAEHVALLESRVRDLERRTDGSESVDRGDR